MQLAPLYQELFLPAFARNENKRREDLRDCASETKERERERERDRACFHLLSRCACEVGFATISKRNTRSPWMRYLALNLSLDAFQDGRIAPPPCSFFVSSWNFRAGKKSVPRNAPPRAEWRARARFRQGHNSPLRIIDDGYAETEYSQASWQASRRVINGRDEIIYAALRRQHAGGSGQLRGHLRPTHGQLGMIHDVASIRDPKSDPNSCRWKMRDKGIPLSQSLRRIAEASTFPLFPTTLRVRARLCNSGWMQRSPSLIRLKEARFRRQWSRLRNPSTTNYENFRRACNNCIDFRLASCQPPGMRKWKNQTCVLREGSLKRWQELEDLISESMHDIWASRRGKRLISRRRLTKIVTNWPACLDLRADCEGASPLIDQDPT